ncbi:hypothetical protein BST95_02630 [Halioglobus japonicus]|uniref:Uncharacterized protein n=1 Tax=Halioglobus japonicus TaxID=930805 RepID=A0AAP8MB05_9GAMM|nr:hypothetical protein BST95_02630 [Halioglobus japonicus]PLW84505.1 hypothetical protein C0029_18820 [Halioglobus japonicus]
MKEELAAILEAYLSGRVGHEAIRSYAWELTDSVPAEPDKNSEPYWSAVFSIIHLADEEHWNDGFTKRDLNAALDQLIGRVD